MKFNQLKSLAAVARAGSIQAAARELHLSQPALSKSIRELERQLGVPLLVRGVEGASLTPYGQIVAKRFLAIQREVDKVREEIDWLRGELGGRLQIGISPPAVSAMIGTAVADFHRMQPLVDLQLLEQRPRQIIESLRSGAIDFGILHHYGDVSIDEFESVTLFTREMVLAVGGSELPQTVSMEYLRDRQWLSADLADDPDGYVFVLARHFGVAPPTRVLRCTSVALCLELAPRMNAVSHWADTALPFLEPHFRTGTMTRLILEQPLPAMNIVLVYRDEELLSPAAAVFVRLLRSLNRSDAATTSDNLPL